MIGRTVAIATNGTRVLGLGNIGAVASMPVMEGKAMFYRQMAGISAIPILIDTEDPDEFIATVDADRARVSARSTSRTSGCPTASRSRLG